MSYNPVGHQVLNVFVFPVNSEDFTVVDENGITVQAQVRVVFRIS